LKWSPKKVVGVLGAGLALCVVLRADLAKWAQNVAAGTGLEAALFRLMDVPGGAVLGRRTPAESRQALGGLIDKDARNSGLYAMRAREDERAMDYKAAEADWRRSAELAIDPVAGMLTLADYYGRRNEPQLQVNTLLAAAKLPVSTEEQLADAVQTRSWKAFQNALAVVKQDKLPAAAENGIYEAWLTRWPKQQAGTYLDYFSALVARHDLTAARAVLDRFRAKYPNEQAKLLSAEASLEDTPEAKLALYTRQFTPTWPQELLSEYYALLHQSNETRAFLADAETKQRTQPNDIDAALRLEFYYEQSGQQDRADVSLIQFVHRHEAGNATWAAEDLRTLGKIFARLHDYDSEAKSWYTLYGLKTVPQDARRDGLAALAALLLDVPEQPIQFASRDLSLYKNVATMDRMPGFLNGILSLALNSSGAEFDYSNASQTAVAYFHRAGAARLIERFRQEFPNATSQEEELSTKLFSTYGVYGQDDTLLAQLPGYLARHPHAPEYVDLALMLGDVYARKHRRPDEFALYDALLKDLAARAQHVPLGNAAPGRSADYARVLDRYLSRLTEERKLRDAVALLRREIDQNPNDAGLYERLAAFVEQNRFDADLEQTYQAAMKKFPGTAWSEKLARFYLRTKRNSDYEQLTKQLTGVFSGEEIESYLEAVHPDQTLNAQLYAQVNLYAHGRFPHNLTFVRNLVRVYGGKEMPNEAAALALLRANWYFAPDLETGYLAYLSKTGGLKQALAALPAARDAAAKSNTLALEFVADGRAWQTHFEEAAPAYAELARLNPGDLDSNRLALSIHRSLSYKSASDFREAVKVGEQDAACDPSSGEDLTTLGELYADRDEYAKAAPYWNRIPAIHPGEQDGYLNAATIFWDYFQYDDALRLIGEGRTAFHNPVLFAYETGAIYENKGQMAQAIDQYLQGALAQTDAKATDPAEARLLQLGRRKATHDLVEQATTTAARGGSMAAFHLRLALLDNQDRRSDVEHLLATQLGTVSRPEAMEQIRADAERLGFPAVEEQALERVAQVAADPVEKLSAELALVSFRERNKDLAGAERDLTTLLRDNPDILGIVRANADFYERNHQPARAAEVLSAAAQRAQLPYRTDLLREAAQQNVDAKDYSAARAQLDVLLKADPFNADLLAAKADTWATAGDDTALAQFYADELQAMQQAPLNATEKNNRIAGLRRGYIEALVRLKKPQEALDQYIEVINRFPEDQSVTAEAAHFAQVNQLGDRLTAYYQKTGQASPKDYRWPMVLARIETVLRRYPEAIADYERACYVRPDRTDLAVAEVDLQTRLLRFEDALKTNQRLYDLTYHNRDYLEAQATLLARLGRKDEALKMLRATLIDGRPPDAANYQQAMSDLATWHMYPEAQQMFEEGLVKVKTAPYETPGFDEYLRILTIERKQDVAIQKASAAVRSARQRVLGFASAGWMTAIGSEMNEYFTAEEKDAEAKWLLSAGHVPRNVSLSALLQSGGFSEAYSQALAGEATQWRQLDTFQRSRLRFRELGKQLEADAEALPSTEQGQVRSMALSAYEAAGDTPDELRMMVANPDLAGNPALYGKLIAGNPAQYAARIPHTDFGNGVVQYLIADTNEQKAEAALRARATANIEALWTPAYVALTGLYYSSAKPEVAQSFDRLLGPRAVGAELAETAAARAAHLSGSNWFYYAARDGDYLAYAKQPSASALLEAGIEASPIASERYVELGDTLRDAGQTAEARQQYDYAQELSPERADVLDRLGALDWDAGNHAGAVKDWQNAFDVLKVRIDAGPLSPSFWPTARILFIHANRHRVIDQVKPNADAMLHLYIKRNGAYQFEPFIEGMFTEAKDRQSALDWLLDLTRDENGREILQELAQSPMLTEAERDPIYRATIARMERAVQAAAGDARTEQQTELNSELVQYANYLAAQKRYQDALRAIDQIPEAGRPKEDEVRLEILNGQLAALIAHWQMKPADSPGSTLLLGIAEALRRLGRADDANRLLEYEYTAEIQAGTAGASAYFGLAKLRFEAKRTAEGLDLVRDAVLSVDAPFVNLPPAGRLLEEEGLPKEANAYYAQWHKAEPWNASAALAEARTNGDVKGMDAVRTKPENAYAVRIAAARAMRAAKTPVAGTMQLDVLTQERISPVDASQSYFVAARLDAAAQTTDWTAKTKLLADAIAIDPGLTDERNKLADAATHANQRYLAIAAYMGDPFNPELAQRIADEEIAVGQPEQAELLLDAIQKSDAATLKQRDHARQEQQRIANRLQLQIVNESRSPEVANGIVQQRIVKPKLTMLPADDVAPVENEGGAQ
jgi:tetratricopeptide (TPR) repeat protein